jgi:undecaprenyl-diphosphatase
LEVGRLAFAGVNDLSISHGLNAWATRHDGFEDPISAYASASEALFVLLLAVLFVAVWGRLRVLARRAAVAAAVSAGIALLIGQVLSHLVDRPRPFVAHPGLIHLFAPHAADASFPSDHTTASFAIATAIMLRNRLWGSFALVAAALLGVSRVVIGVHYPLDVLAGAALGSAVALALHLPPARRVTDRAADVLGAAFDGATRRAGSLIGIRG